MPVAGYVGFAHEIATQVVVRDLHHHVKGAGHDSTILRRKDRDGRRTRERGACDGGQWMGRLVVDGDGITMLFDLGVVIERRYRRERVHAGRDVLQRDSGHRLAVHIDQGFVQQNMIVSAPGLVCLAR